MPEENQSARVPDSLALQELCGETDSWIADLNFRLQEIRFYRKITGHYLKSIDRETTDRVNEVQKVLTGLAAHHQNLQAEVLKYRQHLDQQLKDLQAASGNGDDRSTIRERHERFQTGMHALDREFRELKDNIFDIAEDVFGE